LAAGALVDELRARAVRPVAARRNLANRFGTKRAATFDGPPLRASRRDLAFGRLRTAACATFHGWLFDVSGQCLETPVSRRARRCAKASSSVRSVIEKSGILWAYLAKASRRISRARCFIAPDSHTFTCKGHIN
jgi:hypothetical protein